MTIKLIVSDLDGTLVQEDLAISSHVARTIRQIQEQTNCKVVIATGRMFPSALPYAHKLGIETPIITYQGAMVRHVNNGNETLFQKALPLDLCQDILARCKTQGLHLNVYINDQLYTEPHPIYVEEYQRTSSMTPNIVERMEETLTAPSMKLVMIENDSTQLNAFRAELEQDFGSKQLSLCISRPNFLEITAPGVSKWNAVRFLADRWEISSENILCIGDQENDLSMIESAGIGVAMGNAPEHVKAKADVVVSSIENDGAAEAMQRFVLDQEVLPVA